MGRTRERAWRNDYAPKKKILKQTQKPQRRPLSIVISDDDDSDEENVNVSQGEDKVQSTISDVEIDQKCMKKRISLPSAQSLFGSPRNKKLLHDDDDLPEWAQALEPVRKLPTNAGGRIRRCIYESLNRNAPKWARQILEHSISKEVYKRYASGPTKRTVISVLEKVRVGGEDDENKDDDDGEGEEDEDEKDDEDDKVILDPKQGRCELSENVSLLSDSLEKDSSSQSDIVCVHGYKVKRSTATILEAIFKKHGDIAANCVFKTFSTRSHFLEAVCEVVRRIQTNDMTEMVKDIECQVTDAEAANINVSWIRAHFEAFHKRKQTSKKCSLLMEMKSNTILVGQAAQMDLRETCAELMSAQERFKNAERCVRVLHLVEKSLNDSFLESKSELDSWVKPPVV